MICLSFSAAKIMPVFGRSCSLQNGKGGFGARPVRILFLGSMTVTQRGQRSLSVFCFGVLLSFAAHWILVQVAGGIVAQMLVSVLGIVLLVGIAWIATLYRSLPTLFGTETRVIRIGKDVPIDPGAVPTAAFGETSRLTARPVSSRVCRAIRPRPQPSCYLVRPVR